MNRRVLHCCLAFLSLAPMALAADGDDVILGTGNAFWTDNLSQPLCKELIKLQKQHTFKSVAINSEGDWVVILEGNGFYTSNMGLPVCKQMAKLQKENADFKCVAFAPNGGWTLLWNQNGNWTESEVPDEAFKKMQEVVKGGATLRSIAFAPDGGWVLLFDKTGVLFGGVHKDLAKVLSDAVKNHLTVRCVCFTSLGDWICLTNNGWWTSDLSLSACKLIEDLSKQHQSLKWVAVAPQIGEHDFTKFSNVIHRAYDGKLIGGYGFEIRHEGKIVASGAEGWARAPREKEDPSIKWTFDKPMGIASVSKTVTAVALLKLWEETNHSFKLDDPFWPHIQKICPTAHDDVKRVTIRQLLSQHTGFKKEADITSPKALEKLLNEPLVHKPGEVYQYDNNNFYIARLVIEEISHAKYTPYVKEHVFKPMGITRMETHFEAHQPMCAYGKLAETRPGFPFDWQCDPWAGPAGWYASVSDLGLFLNGLREHRVLSESLTAEMYKQKLGWDVSTPGLAKNGGWNWDEGNKEGARTGYLKSAIVHFPDDVDAVLLTNCDAPIDPEPLIFKAWWQSMKKKPTH
jgi:CubicO group peptidase (beta-lactamase class C family)